MSLQKNQTEAEALEQYRVSFENVKAQSEIAAIMAEFGYDEALIAEGRALLTKTRQAFDFNTKEDDETSQAYKHFLTAKENLIKTYALHRKKARVIFRKDLETLKTLALVGGVPASYVKKIETIKKFYTITSSDTEIQTKLARLKVTLEEIAKATQQITNLEKARSKYLREKGESQDATKAKAAAFTIIDDWMSEFYAVAKIALEDHPQLLESLGKFVRS